MIGFVYILTNDHFAEEVYKIGCTERSPHERAAELSKSTAAPSPFMVICYIEVEGFQAAEKQFHEWLAESRVSPNSEFFEGNLEYALRLMFWYPGRLSFTEPMERFGESALTRYVGAGDWHNTEDPWEKTNPLDGEGPNNISIDADILEAFEQRSAEHAPPAPLVVTGADL